MEVFNALRIAVKDDARSQAEISAAAKLHVVSLSRFMTGKRELSLDGVCKLARALGLEVHLRKFARKK